MESASHVENSVTQLVQQFTIRAQARPRGITALHQGCGCEIPGSSGFGRAGNNPDTLDWVACPDGLGIPCTCRGGSLGAFFAHATSKLAC